MPERYAYAEAKTVLNCSRRQNSPILWTGSPIGKNDGLRLDMRLAGGSKPDLTYDRLEFGEQSMVSGQLGLASQVERDAASHVSIGRRQL